MLFGMVRHRCACEKLTVPGSGDAVDDHPLLYVDTAIARHIQEEEAIEVHSDGPFSPELYLTALVNSFNLLLDSALLESCAGSAAHGSKQRHGRRQKLVPSLSLLMGRLLIVMNHLQQRHWHEVTMRLDILYKLCFGFVLTTVEQFSLLPVGPSFDRLPSLLPLSAFPIVEILSRRNANSLSLSQSVDADEHGAPHELDVDPLLLDQQGTSSRRRRGRLRRSLRPSAFRPSSSRQQPPQHQHQHQHQQHHHQQSLGSLAADERCKPSRSHSRWSRSKSGKTACGSAGSGGSDKYTRELLHRMAASTGVKLNEFQSAAVLTTEDGIILAVNALALELLDYRASELVGKNIVIIMPERYRDQHPSYMSRYQRTHDRRLIGKPRQLEVVNKAGRRIPVVISLGESIVAGRSVYVGEMFLRSVGDWISQAPGEPLATTASGSSSGSSLPASTEEPSVIAVHYRSCTHGRPARFAVTNS
jgi:PAS domain S-box-containing protein